MPPLAAGTIQRYRREALILNFCWKADAPPNFPMMRSALLMAISIALFALRLQAESCDFAYSENMGTSEDDLMDVAWIREQLTKPGKSQAGLARALNLNPSQINRLLKGNRQLKANEIEKVRAYFDVSLGSVPLRWGLQDDRTATIDMPQDTLKVLGMAEGGPDGWNLFNGEVVEVMRRPDNLIGVAGAYAVYVTGSSMEPRYHPGEVAHIHPGKPVMPGAYVLVQRKPGHDGEPPLAVIKRLVKRSGSKIVLEQHNPSKIIEIRADEVVSIHRVVGSSEA